MLFLASGRSHFARAFTEGVRSVCQRRLRPVLVRKFPRLATCKAVSQGPPIPFAWILISTESSVLLLHAAVVAPGRRRRTWILHRSNDNVPESWVAYTYVYIYVLCGRGCCFNSTWQPGRTTRLRHDRSPGEPLSGCIKVTPLLSTNRKIR